VIKNFNSRFHNHFGFRLLAGRRGMRNLYRQS
jgi:hypothetical protein